VLSLWELNHRDSPAATVLAIFFFITMTTTLGWACYKILMIGKHSSILDPTLGPAYTLYSDPAALNRWGYLYVQFRTERYYHIVPLLIYILAKSVVIAFAQTAGVAQSLIVLFIELAYLVVVCRLRPFLDRRTNIVNIAIVLVNFLNGIFVMVFSGVTRGPAMVPGIMGVIFFVVNAVFALVLLVLLLVAVGFALFSKNPEQRYRETNALSHNEKKPARDLDADPSSPPQHGGVQSHSLHDLSIRDRDAESERAVGMDHSLSIRSQRSPPSAWADTPGSAAFGSPLPPPHPIGKRSPSMMSSVSSMPSSHGSRRNRAAVESVFNPPSAAQYEQRERERGTKPDWNRGVGFEQ